MKKSILPIIIAVVLSAAACIVAPGIELPHDNSFDPLNPDNFLSITVNPNGAENGEGVTADITEAADGTEVTLTAALNSDIYRMVRLSADGAGLSSEQLLADGGTSTFTIDGSDVTITAEFADRNTETIIHAGDKGTNDIFGFSVSIDGDYAIAGARNGTGDTYMAGAAYIFKNDGSGNWTEEDRLQASDRDANDYFGSSVCINGEYAFIGAPDEDGGDDDGSKDGAVYIFKKDNGAETWSQVDIIYASDNDTEDHFGSSVSIKRRLCNSRRLYGRRGG